LSGACGRAGTPDTPSAPLSGLPDAPAWASAATPREAYLRGLATIASTPGYVLVATSIGFGALARDLGVSFGQAVFLSSVLYALPAQVMLVDQLARGAGLAAAAFAVTLTAVRLLPMTVSLLPYLRDQRGLRPVHILAVHFVAITVWLEGNQRLPKLPEHLRLPHFFGIGSAMFLATGLGTIAGHALAAVVPPLLSAALLFMTPVYFLLSLASGARLRMDWLAIGFGVSLGPILFQLVPGPDLMLTGLIGGTAAYLAGRQPS
jgi:predicted branched-subunit amino acid permease